MDKGSGQAIGRGDGMTEPDAASLTGFTVAITASRRVDEFTTMLRRRGADVVAAAAMNMVPLADDVRLRAATEDVIDAPPDLLIVTTGIGFRGWVEAAKGWGVADALLGALGKARVISRGPKATGALRAAGLREEWSPISESSEEVLVHLTVDDLKGKHVAVQLHGATDDWDPVPWFIDTLVERGATVVGVQVYRWEPPEHPSALDGLIEKVALGGVDAITFTSAPAAASFLMRADELRLTEAVRRAMNSTVTTFCVGPVTARPLGNAGVTSVQPDRMRLAALARAVADAPPARFGGRRAHPGGARYLRRRRRRRARPVTQLDGSAQAAGIGARGGGVARRHAGSARRRQPTRGRGRGRAPAVGDRCQGADRHRGQTWLPTGGGLQARRRRGAALTTLLLAHRTRNPLSVRTIGVDVVVRARA